MFKVGDKVKETNYGYVGHIIAPGDDCDWLVEFEHGAVAQLQPNRLEHVNDSVVPYVGSMSHTAAALVGAVWMCSCVFKSEGVVNVWQQWNDEARYLAGVIIGSYDATIYG